MTPAIGVTEWSLWRRPPEQRDGRLRRDPPLGGVTAHRARLGASRPSASAWSKPPTADAAAAVHSEAHGLIADDIYQVEEGA